MIPLEQGSVFRPNVVAATRTSVVSLNPFGTGLCLPTNLAGIGQLTR